MEHPQATSNKTRLYLRSPSGRIPLALPSGWRLSTLADFPEDTEIKNALTLSQASLHKPLGTKPPEHFLKSSDRICILIEDLTRTPLKHLLIKAVLDLFERIGIAKDHITILIALGTHQPLAERQSSNIFGSATVDRYSFVKHDFNGDDLVTIGELSSGTPVKINKLAACADSRLGIGSIFLHPLNGFSSGGKMLNFRTKKFSPLVWRECIKIVWEVESLLCSHCGGLMKIVSFVYERKVLIKSLAHLGLLEERGAKRNRAPPVPVNTCGRMSIEPYDDG